MGTRHRGRYKGDDGNWVEYDYVERLVVTRAVCRAVWGTVRFIWRWRDVFVLVPCAVVAWWVFTSPWLLIIFGPLGLLVIKNKALNPEPDPFAQFFEDHS